MRHLKNFVALDVETTGLDANGRDRIIEIGAVLYQDGCETATFQTLINPKIRLPPAITRLTGIQSQDLTTAPLEQEVIPRFVQFLARHPLVAHNASFDLRFLGRACRRHGMNTLTNLTICTLKEARRLLPNRPSYRLVDLTQGLATPTNAQAHRALYDARLAATLYQALKMRL